MKIDSSIYQESRHLEDSYLLPPHSTCVFCGSVERSPVYVLQDDPAVLLLNCGSCHAATASRLPTPEALEMYYRKYYEAKKFKDKKSEVTFHDAEKFGAHLARQIIKHLDKADSVSILDFGGGDGANALKAAEKLLENDFKNVSIVVVDYNKGVVTANDPRISIKHYQTLDLVPPGSFDFVIASAIIEHIPEPKEVMDRLSSFLKERGIFYFRTPYIEPFLKISAFLNLRLMDFGFPGHVHDLGRQFWESSFVNVLYPNEFKVLLSRPSMVETSFKRNFLRTLAAYLFKSPWGIFGDWYQLWGGWEVFLQKENKTRKESL